MAFFHTIVKIANSLSGYVRSFNGDSLLVFFPGTSKTTLSNAVKAAMQMKYMISDKEGGINNQLKKYSPIDFGIGIDDGKILCTKVGIAGTNNRDLIWVGNPVNKAVVLSDFSKSPRHIAISSLVYTNLLDNVKYGKRKNYLGQDENVDMWSMSTFTFNNTSEYYYSTSWQTLLS